VSLLKKNWQNVSMQLITSHWVKSLLCYLLFYGGYVLNHWNIVLLWIVFASVLCFGIFNPVEPFIDLI
jgi:hypothetical protein